MASTIEERLAEATRKADEAHKAAYGNSEGTPGTAPAANGGTAGGQGAPDHSQDGVDYKHQYEVLKGKYNAEVPRLYKMVNELSQQVQAAPRATLEDEGATQVVDLTAMKDEELPEKLREFKGEYPDVFNGIAEVMKLGKAKKTEKAPAEKPGAAQPAAPAAPAKKAWDQGMYQVLSMKAPKWEETNRNPEFLGWLTQTDRYARKTRGDLMKEAYAAGDIDTVANIFNDWAEFGQSAPAGSNEDLAPPSGSPNLNAPITNAGDVKPIPRAEVEKFYRDVAMGKFKGKEKEQAAMEARIEAAMLARAIV